MTSKERLLVAIVLGVWMIGSVALLVFQPQPFVHWLAPATFSEHAVE